MMANITILTILQSSPQATYYRRARTGKELGSKEKVKSASGNYDADPYTTKSTIPEAHNMMSETFTAALQD